MTYEEFLEFVPAKCLYETIYDDSDGRTVLVIRMLDAYRMVTKVIEEAEQKPVKKREWVGLTDEEMEMLWKDGGWYVTMFKAVEAKLKEKNT